MRRALVGMQPDRFEDLIALVALYRPGPMANIPAYCARKLGREKPDYIHPKLEPILKATYGVITYQEQVMQIARDLAGYSMGEADLLRRAMGKKIRSEMEKQRVRFITGAIERGISQRRCRGDLRRLREVRRLRLQQVALRALRADHVPDRLSEGELPGRVPRRVDDARHEQHRQAQRIPSGGARGSASRSSRPTSTARASCFEVDGGQDRLRARGAEGRRRRTWWSISSASAAGKPFDDLADFAAPHRSADRQPQGAGMPGAGRRVRHARAAARQGLREHRQDPSRRRRSAAAARRAASPISSATAARRRRCSFPRPIRGRRPSMLQREFLAIGTYLSAHPISDYAALVRAQRRR